MLGCLVLEGALVARTHLLENARATELLGPGDVIWPWMQNPGDATFSTAVDWSILVESEVAILGPLFMRRAAPWPQIFSALMTRLALRARGLDVLLALRQVRGIEHRILVLLWSLADRFGKVTAEGVRLEVPLTHQLLADLVGARRPTVTTALSQLRTRALLRVLPGERGWVLTGLPPLEALATGGLRTPLRAGA